MAISKEAQLAEAAYANFFSNSGALLTSEADVIAALIANKFSEAQATAFAARYQVVSQYTAASFFGLTGTGFSATVFLDTTTNQYSFSIRGSTGANDFTADAQFIATDGIAVAQLVDMYNYWQSLTHLGVYQVAKLTTQSLASSFLTDLYTLNFAGIPTALLNLYTGFTIPTTYDAARAFFISQGYVVEGGAVYKIETDLSTNVYSDSRQWGSGTLAGQTVNVDGHSLGGSSANDNVWRMIA